jgi:hypothetical protein
MSGMSPSSVLFSSDGYELAVVHNDPFVPGTRSILFAGNDGTNTRTVLIDSSARQVVVGAGTAGTPAGGVITIQGDPAMTPVIVNQGTSPWVISGTVAVSSVGGTVAVTQSTSPWVVSGTVTSNQGTPNSLANAWPITITDGYGQIQGSAVNPIYVTGNITASNPSVGADDGLALGFDTQVGGIVSTAAPTYTNGDLKALSLTTLGGLRIDGVYAVATANATAANVMNSGGYVTTAAPTYTTGQLNPLSLDTNGSLRTFSKRSTASTVTSVSPTPNANNTLLASNANRIYATVFNNTDKTLFIKLGATASATSFTTQLFKGSYWEIPGDYTGIIDAFAPGGTSGSVLVTELSP